MNNWFLYLWTFRKYNNFSASSINGIKKVNLSYQEKVWQDCKKTIHFFLKLLKYGFKAKNINKHRKIQN